MSSFQGKGSTPRPTSISKKEKDLRHELIFAKPKRKQEIIKILKGLNDEN